MDLFALIMVVIAIIIIFTLCGACCKNKRTPVTYTTATVVTTIPTSNSAPYPVQQTIMPIPQNGALNVGIVNCPYPTNSQPGFVPGPAYPPYPQPAPIPAMVQQNPPSYAEATGVYAKQSPYNPQFQ